MAEATYKKLDDGTWGVWVKGRKVKPGSIVGVKVSGDRIEERRVAAVLYTNGAEGKDLLCLCRIEGT